MDVLAVAVIVGATLAAFWPGLHGQFLNWDDDRNFVDNPAFQGLGREQLRWAWSTYHLGVWQPLSWLLLSLQYRLGDLNPLLYHAVSLALHTVNSAVFYLLIVEILQVALPRRQQASTIALRACAAGAAVLFAVHPLRTEVVAWISCQPYLPAALFYMLSVLAWVRGHRDEAGRAGRVAWPAASFVLFVLAVMSKAVAVSLPVVLIILDVYPLRRWGGRKGWLGGAAARVWAEKLPFIAVAIVVSLWAAAAKDFNESRVPFAVGAMDARVAQSACGLLFYLHKTIVPSGLIPYYDLPGNLSLLTWHYSLYAGWVLAATVGLLLLRRWWPAGLAAWLAYIVVLLPNLGVVQISQQLAADRYSYIAIMPLMMLLAGGAAALCRQHSISSRAAQVLSPSSADQEVGRYVAGGAAALGMSRYGRQRAIRIALVAGLAVATVALGSVSRRQALIWRDSASLWRATLAVSPDCAVAECNLGIARLADGQYQEASRHLSRAIELDPEFAFATANFGVLCLQASRPEDAVEFFLRALSLGTDLGKPDLARIHAGLGAAYAALRRDDLAWKHTRIAQQLGFKDAQKMIDYLRRFSKEPAAKD